MRRHSAWLVCILACTGCHTLPDVAPVAEPTPADALWRQGQTALGQGKAREAVDLYERSLAADPSRKRNHLSLAAAHLEAGDPKAACDHLGKYLAHYPEHVVVRAQYAELLLRLGREAEARTEFARFARDAQDAADAEMRRRIHAHGRLME